MPNIEVKIHNIGYINMGTAEETMNTTKDKWDYHILHVIMTKYS